MSEHNNLLADLQTSEQTHFNRFERGLSKQSIWVCYCNIQTQKIILNKILTFRAAATSSDSTSNPWSHNSTIHVNM